MNSKKEKCLNPLEKDWEEAVELCTRDARLFAAKMANSGDTALHLAAVHGEQGILAKLVDAIKSMTGPVGCARTLSAKNNRGYTPLHHAASASRGSLEMCKTILSDKFFYPLVHIRNKEGETPLFLAALNGHKQTFLFLHSVSLECPSLDTTWRRNGGDTILHCTLQKENFDLSFLVIQLYKDQHIATAFNEKGVTPIHVLAGKPSGFQSSARFRWWSKLLYHCTIVEPLQVDVHPPNYATCFEFYKFVSGLWGFGLLGTRKLKEKHVWCSQVMEALVQEYCKADYSLDDGAEPRVLAPEQEEVFSMNIDKPKDTASSSNDAKNGNEDQQNQQGKTSEKDGQHKKMKKMTPLLIAAKNGVIELVKNILCIVPFAIHDATTKNENILLVAVEHRQPHIVEALRNHDLWSILIQSVDNEGNNALHLAAKYKAKPWHISGSAMQMHSEIKWYQFVEEMVPDHIKFQANDKGETPYEIFTESHKDLVKEGGEWLKKTADSCSVVAALIAGVSFATSSSVPGGTNDQTGKPTLEGQPAFNVFAVSSLIALCFSVTALIMFLAILTSRQRPRDYRRDLPLKLLLGLSFLFVSIFFMLISFCAAYFFLLKDRIHNVLFVIYAAISLPVSLYAVAQFPLYWDLLTAILSKIPQPTHKGE